LGKTPEGLDWRADVLCRRPGKAWSVGFEAQVQLKAKTPTGSGRSAIPLQVLSGLAPLPLADEGWLGIGPPLTKGADEDAVLGMRVGRRSGATRAHRPGLSPVPLPTCGKQFNERSGTLLNRTQYPSDVIALVVLWRLRYKLSLRDLPEMFAVRGIVFSYEASGSGRPSSRRPWPRLCGGAGAARWAAAGTSMRHT
jgi:hypothetical protein